jgi:hypothetical protein
VKHGAAGRLLWRLAAARQSGGSMPTQEERDRAMAVSSVDDETRVHSGGDETSLVMDAGGELQQPPASSADAKESSDPGPPMNPDTSEATPPQLELARLQGDAYADAVRCMADEVADDGGEARAGDYVISYAVEEAEGMYDWVDGALVWQDPGETTTHLEVAVRDAGDGRFVPGAKVTVTMISPDGTEVGTEHHPLLWHPMVYHYGRNWQLPVDGEYVMRVHVEPPTFTRHDEVNGRRFTAAVDVEFDRVRVHLDAKLEVGRTQVRRA